MDKRVMLFYLLNLLVASSLKAEVEIPTSINNTSSEESLILNGIQASIVPSADMVMLEGAINLIDTTHGFVTKGVQLDGAFDFDEVMTESDLERFNADMIMSQRIKVNGFDGGLYKVEVDRFTTAVTNYMLFFGNDDFTIGVVVFYEASEDHLAEHALKILLSTCYEKDAEVDPLNAISFKVDLSDSEFDYAGIRDREYIFNKIGKVPRYSTSSRIALEDASGFVRNNERRIYSVSLANNTEYVEKRDSFYTDTITLDGVHGYATTIYGTHPNGSSAMIYQVILFSDNTIYRMFFYGYKEEPELMNEFRQIAQTFRKNSLFDGV